MRKLSYHHGIDKKLFKEGDFDKDKGQYGIPNSEEQAIKAVDVRTPKTVVTQQDHAGQFQEQDQGVQQAYCAQGQTQVF
ncbi:hypothetical protein [Anaeromusa sp.]|uniref:hypothetical protein n=1 Tax=Anaeromusa sp. TaxID=1872520 RepID=UPI0026264279|nr:hypothetical protein [Anaeromusa sp.]MDD3159041.1 hypothetical protein [Anaeromusa sp.]